MVEHAPDGDWKCCLCVEVTLPPRLPAQNTAFEAAEPGLEAANLENLRDQIENLWAKGVDENGSSVCGDLKVRDFKSLAPEQWLNDEIINASVRHYTNCSQLRVKPVSTFYFSKLVDLKAGRKAVETWLTAKHVDPDNHDIVLIPVHLSIHWALVVLFCADRRVEYLDPLDWPGEVVVENIMKVLNGFPILHGPGFPAPKTWTWTGGGNIIPRQQNGYDCGMFVIEYCKHFCEGRTNWVVPDVAACSEKARFLLAALLLEHHK
jgi:sentrin-specific protease 1